MAVGDAVTALQGEARRRSVEICRRLCEAVAQLAPPGLGYWSRTWDIVGDTDSELVSALTAWQADPTSEPCQQAVRDASAAVLRAWRQAVSEFEARGPSA